LRIRQGLSISPPEVNPVKGVKEIMEELIKSKIYQHADKNMKINSLRILIQALLENPSLIEEYESLIFCNNIGKFS